MKLNRIMQKAIPSAVAGLALAVSVGVSLASDITYDFSSDAQGWYAADGHGTVEWDSAHGRGGNGCLICTIPSDGTTNGTTEIDPRVDVDYNTLGYFSVEYDLMVDSASGTDDNGTYGNLQMVDWDAGWNWHSEWYGTLGGPAGNFDGQWKHIKQGFTATYGARVRLAFQIAASAGAFSTNVVIYIDNVIIRDGTPPNQAMAYSFTQPDECVPDNSWGSGPPVFSQDTTVSSNGPCLKQVVNYGPTNSGWVDAPAEFHDFNFPSFDPSKFTYVDFDLMIDAPTGMATYGQYQLHYWWSWAGIATVPLSEANIGKWTHYSFPLPASTAEHGIVLHPGGNNLSNTITYYLDNVTLWKPASPPTIKQQVKGSGAGGVQITMASGGQWEREAIVTPLGVYSWAVQSAYPVSYSFTITNFPDAVAHHGFEAHMYLVNGDTDTSGWDRTYGGVDWNAPDLLKFTVENNEAGGAIARVDWKTNTPGGNPPTNAIYHPAYVEGPAVIGTWTLTFTNATDFEVTGPGVSTNGTLPLEAVQNSFSPSQDYLQFGMFKNDGAGDGHNDGVSGTFSAVEMDVAGGPVFADTFPGPGLQAVVLWDKTTSSGGATDVQWVPPGIGYWLTWTLPDDEFEAFVADKINGPWTDAGVGSTNGFSYVLGALRTGGIPAASMPAGSTTNCFFQLRK